MIKIENAQIVGLEPAIRGMRNPMNSWEKSDSGMCDVIGDNYGDILPSDFRVGKADYDLMLHCGVSFEKIPTIYKLSPLWSPSLYIQYEGEIVRNWFLQEMKGCETKKASDFIIEELESLGYKESAAIFRNQEKYYS